MEFRGSTDLPLIIQKWLKCLLKILHVHLCGAPIHNASINSLVKLQQVSVYNTVSLYTEHATVKPTSTFVWNYRYLHADRALH